jgi:hypothetical protein
MIVEAEPYVPAFTAHPAASAGTPWIDCSKGLASHENQGFSINPQGLKNPHTVCIVY